MTSIDVGATHVEEIPPCHCPHGRADVSAEAYADIVIRFKSGTVLFIGSKSFFDGLMAKTQGAVTQVNLLPEEILSEYGL